MTWTPDPDLFLADLEAKPEVLAALARSLRRDDPWRAVDPSRFARVVVLGMGSSRYAALAAASRLRARRIDAVAEYATATAAHPGGPSTLAIGISASGTSEETIAALERQRASGSTTVALTNSPGSPLTAVAALTVELGAGTERGGVACRSYQHTLALLLALERRLAHGGAADAAEWVAAAASASSALLECREQWLPAARDVLTGSGQAFLIAPSERLCSAEQGALMLREGPRLPADACETGDWSHVDVYLTRPLDYRALVFAGSGREPEALRWLRERGAAFVGVGAELEGASVSVRYPGEESEAVALLTEVLVPELVAARCWQEASR